MDTIEKHSLGAGQMPEVSFGAAAGGYELGLGVDGDGAPPPPAIPMSIPRRSPAALLGKFVPPPPLRFRQTTTSAAGGFEPYSMGMQLGKGAFGKVVAVEDCGGWGYAMKICDRAELSKKPYHETIAHDTCEPSAVRSLLTEYDAVCREVQILQSLSHPGIVRIYDVAETLSKTYIVMERLNHQLLDMESLERMCCPLTKQRYSEARARRVAHKMVSAMAHLHTRGVWHGDIKPSNILMRSTTCSQESHRFEPVLVDFGRAHTSKGEVPRIAQAGTVAFACPESFAGFFDPFPADVWAMGVSIFCMVAGFAPFTPEKGRALVGADHECYSDAQALCVAITKGEWMQDFTCLAHEDDTELMNSNYTAQSRAAVAPSPELVDLLSGMLNPDGMKRLTASQATAHPWFRS